MLAHWCLSSNFGDMLTYWLVRKITGQAPQFTNTADTRKHLVAVGSMLNHAGNASVVWGAGIANMSDQINVNADIRSVRGPLSALRVVTSGGKMPRVWGDPGLLVPKYHQAKPKQHKLGFIPHYADKSVWPLSGALNIDVLAPVEEVLDAISSCQHIISSSLHGLIVADAYGIPAAWMYSPRVLGDGCKFADHMLAVGGHITAPLQFDDVVNKPVASVIEMIEPRKVHFNSQSILAAFPKEL